MSSYVGHFIIKGSSIFYFLCKVFWNWHPCLGFGQTILTSMCNFGSWFESKYGMRHFLQNFLELHLSFTATYCQRHKSFMSIKFGFKTSDIVRNCKIFLSLPNICWYMVIRLQEIVKINFAKALPAYEKCYYGYKDVIICMNESKIEKSCFILFIKIYSTYFINLTIHKPYTCIIKGTTVKLV